MIALRDITIENYEQCLDLTVHDSQKNFVASNVRSLADAWVFYRAAKPFAIYNNDEMVGFLMLDLDCDYDGTGKVFLWRLMIDKNHQNRGYGKAALKLALQYVRKNCNVDKMRTSYEPNNIVVAKLYKDFGFVETGETLYGETVVELQFSKHT